ncbi:MAG: xanthine dehydrogenase family protein [Deltaproteobacteria bacterium]|nr:xanthine dehydrogenase family protein [Deltaproteobacteria bacterium]
MLHLDFVRSTHAQARIAAIDTSEAAKCPGVVAVYTAEEIHGFVPLLPGPAELPGLRAPEHHVLANGHVRYVGEAVAAVVAEERYTARDAREAIRVDYEPLPAVTDMERALEADAPLVHEEFGSNLAFELPLGNETAAALEEADVVIRQRMLNQRVIPNTMETRGVVADYRRSDGQITVWLSTQAPHLIRSLLAELLDLPEHRLRVIAPDVGGGFGAKANLYGEEMLAVALAKQLGRPVKWIEERQEHMLATSHGRAQLAHVTLGAARDGTIRALELRILADMGAYPHIMTPLAPLQTAAVMTGCYRIPCARAEIQGVFTNTTAPDPYRGFGRAEAAYYLERAIDLLARRLDLDPIEVRRRNFIQPEEFPYSSPTGYVLESGDYEVCLRRALEKVDIGALRQQQGRLRSEGRYIGIGFASYVYRAGFPSLPKLPRTGFLKGGWESAWLRVDPMGKVTVLTGTSPHGQGLETSLAQIAADELDIDLEDVVVRHGDTASIPHGNGTMGSRSLAVGGSAVLLAAREVRHKALRLAAHHLGVEVDAVRLEAGRAFLPGHPERAISFADLADLSYSFLDLPDGMTPRLEASATFEPHNWNAPFGTHVCVVEVDVQTGEPKLLRYVAVDDCGRAVNPLIVEGQIHGGVAQGLGQALMETVVYDSEGQPLTVSFLEYATPTASDMPTLEVELTETPSPLNPLGARGVGESGTTGAPPALVNAVVDALAPFGVEHLDMPLLPERVWRVLHEAGATR